MTIALFSLYFVTCGGGGLQEVTHHPSWPTAPLEHQSTPLPLDGDWTLYAPSTAVGTDQVTLQIANGYVYLVRPYTIDAILPPFLPNEGLGHHKLFHYALPAKAVVGKNLTQVGPRDYECDWAIFRPVETSNPSSAELIESFAPARATISTARSLVITVLGRGTGGVDPILSGGEKVLTRAAQNAQSISQGVPPNFAATAPVETSFESKVEYRLTNTDEYEIPAGTHVRINHTEDTQREVSVGADIALQGSLSLDVIAWLKAAIQAQVEMKLGTATRESVGKQRELILDGTTTTRYRIEWYDRIQKGTVTFQIGSESNQNLPFEVKEGEFVRVIPLNPQRLAS